MTQSTQENGLSYDTKTIIVILLLVVFYPVGLVLMYLWMKWPVWLKIVLSLPVFALFLVPLVIAGLLVAINPSAQIAKAVDAQAKSNANTIVNAVARYYVEKEAYPWGKGEAVYSSSDVGNEAWMNELVASGQLMERSIESIKEGKRLVLVKEANMMGQVRVCFEPETKGSGDVVCVPEGGIKN